MVGFDIRITNNIGHYRIISPLLLRLFCSFTKGGGGGCAVN
jgi:hypothetical protein